MATPWQRLGHMLGLWLRMVRFMRNFNRPAMQSVEAQSPRHVAGCQRRRKHVGQAAIILSRFDPTLRFASTKQGSGVGASLCLLGFAFNALSAAPCCSVLATHARLHAPLPPMGMCPVDGLGTGDSLAAPRRGGRHGRLHGGLGRQPGEGAPRVGNSDLDSGGKEDPADHSFSLRCRFHGGVLVMGHSFPQ